MRPFVLCKQVNRGLEIHQSQMESKAKHGEPTQRFRPSRVMYSEPQRGICRGLHRLARILVLRVLENRIISFTVAHATRSMRWHPAALGLQLQRVLPFHFKPGLKNSPQKAAAELRCSSSGISRSTQHTMHVHTGPF